MVIFTHCGYPFTEAEMTSKTSILAARPNGHLARDRTDEAGGATFPLTFPRWLGSPGAIKDGDFMARVLILLLMACALPAASRAAELRCTDADQSTWLPPAAVVQMLREHGFTDVGAVAVDAGNCYVVEASDQSGAKRTLYLDPTDGALMAME